MNQHTFPTFVKSFGNLYKRAGLAPADYPTISFNELAELTFTFDFVNAFDVFLNYLIVRLDLAFELDWDKDNRVITLRHQRPLRHDILGLPRYEFRGYSYTDDEMYPDSLPAIDRQRIESQS